MTSRLLTTLMLLLCWLLLLVAGASAGMSDSELYYARRTLRVSHTELLCPVAALHNLWHYQSSLLTHKLRRQGQ